MTTPTPKKKTVSLRQIEVLVEFLENHRDLAIGRLRSREARAMSHRLWAECANLLNAEPDGLSRSPKEWQKWYTDFKSRILARQRQIKANIGGTGGGAGVPVVPLGAAEERLCTLLQGNTPLLGRDGTPPEQVRINPIHEIEELLPEHDGVDTGDIQFIDDPVIIINENTEDEVRRSPIHSPVLVPNRTLHQRSKRSRRSTNRRLRGEQGFQNEATREELPRSENNNALEDSRQMLIKLETQRCESTKLLAESIKQLAASLAQNAEATIELAQSVRAGRNQHCCCLRRSQCDDHESPPDC